MPNRSKFVVFDGAFFFLFYIRKKKRKELWLMVNRFFLSRGGTI